MVLMALVIGGVVAVGVSGVLLWQRTTGRESDASIVAFPKTSVVRTVPVANEERMVDVRDGSNVDVRFPRLSGLSDSAVEQRVNDVIRAHIEAEIVGFVSGLSGVDATVLPEASQSTFQSTYEVVYLDATIASMVFRHTSYVAGAAHPYGYVTTLTFDLTRGVPLALDDVLTGDRYLETIAQYVFNDVLAQVGITADADEATVGWIREGSSPIPKQYERFTVSPDGLRVYFDPYQVASYAAGSFEVRIPYAVFREHVRPNGPLSEWVRE